MKLPQSALSIMLLLAPPSALAAEWIEIQAVRQLQCSTDRWQGEALHYLHASVLVSADDATKSPLHLRIIRHEARRSDTDRSYFECNRIRQAMREGEHLEVLVDADGFVWELR